MKQNKNNRFAALLLALCMAVCCALPALAAPAASANIDLSRTGSMDVTLYDYQNDVPLRGGALTVYKVADVARTNGDLHYATELVKFVRKEFGDKFTIAVAGSPEGHIQCRSLEADIAFLKQKQDNGADFIISQLCWDMDAFRYWLEAIRNAGIWLPVDVGIMPILDQAATINMALSRNGCVMDRKLCEIISKNWIFPNPFDKEPFDADVAGKKESFKKAGIEYTINQIDEYRACGVDGIHLYALNKYDDVAYIAKEAGLIDLV